jgi:hypothetical protein
MSDSVGLLPPAVDIVRWRKCGVLRWLVTNPSSAGGTGSFGHADHVPIKLRHP